MFSLLLQEIQTCSCKVTASCISTIYQRFKMNFSKKGSNTMGHRDCSPHVSYFTQRILTEFQSAKTSNSEIKPKIQIKKTNKTKPSQPNHPCAWHTICNYPVIMAFTLLCGMCVYSLILAPVSEKVAVSQSNHSTAFRETCIYHWYECWYYSFIHSFYLFTVFPTSMTWCVLILLCSLQRIH